ncbi:hypothetical protein O5707_07160 [Escherichia coli]|nr:hypothetical protein [Escherichia coli]
MRLLPTVAVVGITAQRNSYRIAIFRASNLPAMVCATPASAALTISSVATRLMVTPGSAPVDQHVMAGGVAVCRHSAGHRRCYRQLAWPSAVTAECRNRHAQLPEASVVVV